MSNSPMVVAIIDDEPCVRAATARLLDAHGFKTELYASGEAFLEAAAASQAACLVIDINLGGITGLELARQLITAGFAFQIIFVTAKDDGHLRRQAIEIGCIGFLRKPYPADELIEALIAAQR